MSIQRYVISLDETWPAFALIGAVRINKVTNPTTAILYTLTKLFSWLLKYDTIRFVFAAL